MDHKDILFAENISKFIYELTFNKSYSTEILKKAFQNPNRRDIVYLKMIDRVETNRFPAKYAVILDKILSMIRSSITTYIPSHEILVELQIFCQDHLNLVNEEKKLVQSLKYLSVLLGKLIQKNNVAMLKKSGQKIFIVPPKINLSHRTRSASSFYSRKELAIQRAPSEKSLLERKPSKEISREEFRSLTSSMYTKHSKSEEDLVTGASSEIDIPPQQRRKSHKSKHKEKKKGKESRKTIS